MKILRILCLGAAIVIPQLALAKLPLTNEAFGNLEGILDFCTQTNPQAASKYQERKKALVRDVPEKEVTEARESHEYRDAYEAVSAELSQTPKDKAVEACAASVEGDK